MDSTDYEKENRIFTYLNEEIDKCIANKKDDVNYDFIEKASKNYLKSDNIVNKPNNEYVINMPMDRTIKTMLCFFKSIDEVFYNQAKDIIEQKSKTELKIYEKEKMQNIEQRDKEGFAIYTDHPCIESNGKKSVIHIHKTEKIIDIYAIVHEIAHTFCNNKNNNFRAMYTENLSIFFEKLLSEFLIENINSQQLNMEVQNRTNEFSSYYNKNALEISLKTKLTRIKQENGVIKRQDMINCQNEYDKESYQILNLIAAFDNNMNYSSRYVIGDLISSRMVTNYELDPNSTVIKLKEYISYMNAGNCKEALECFDIKLEDSCIVSLINDKNDYYKKLSNEKSKNSIINTIKENDKSDLENR
ncbi:MAG: hypothetical protein RSG48_03155 [Clostridia bacterium]